MTIAELTASTGALERHYTVQEIGEIWKLSRNTVTRLFCDETGVLKIGPKRTVRGRRRYTTLRIPESVVHRVYRRLAVP